MYRKIRVRDKDRVYHHIIWRRSLEEKVQEYKLHTVTYIVNFAPFIMLRYLLQLNFDDGAKFSRTKGLLIYYTYIDDTVAGADNVEDLLVIKSDLIHLLQRGKFKLKK